MEDHPAGRRPDGQVEGQGSAEVGRFAGAASRRSAARDGTARPSPPPARPAPEAGFDIGALTHAVWRRKLTVAAFGFGLAFLAMALVYAVTPRYTATSVVMLDQSQDQIIDLESVVSGLGADFYTIAAETQVLRSRALAERVVEAMNLDAHPYFNPDLVEPGDPPLVLALISDAVELVKNAVRGAVSEAEAPGQELLEPEYWVRQRAIDTLLAVTSASNVDQTYVYAITAETPDPLLSADIANEMAEAYILDQLETKFEATQAATEWLANRVAELKTELERAEAAVEAYNSSASLVSEGQLAAMNVQIKDLRERRQELAAAQRDGEASDALVRAAVAAGDHAAAAAELGAPRLAALARDIDALSETPGAEEARDDAVERFEEAAAVIIERRAAERARGVRQIDAIDASIADLETQLSRQTEDLVELRQLQREAEASGRIYEQFLRRLNETSVQVGVQQADARILSQAVVSFLPSYPRKTLTVLAAGFLGGLIGIAFVIVMDQTNRSYRTSEELGSNTGLPVLGAIPSAPARSRRSLLGYAVERPSSSLMEAVRNMRTGLLLANMDDPPQLVMLTSSLPKEGKTTCSLLLAQNAAALGRKVLLIECDLRRRTFRSYFDLGTDKGLMSALTGAASFDEVVHRDTATGLDVIAGEETKVNAADVFSSRRFAEFLEEARRRYDFVVVDTPPVLAVPDARVIAPLADAVLYCVRWNSTHRDLVRDGLEAFSSIGVAVAGLALTQINVKKMAAYGYGGYGRYYYRASNRYYRD